MEKAQQKQKKISRFYEPQEKQALLHGCDAHEILYGGAKGGGKSWALRCGEAFDWCVQVPYLQAYLFRRTYPELWDNHLKFAFREFDKEICKFHKVERVFEFNNGAMLHFAYCQHEQDVLKYQGRAMHLLLIDEITFWTKWMYQQLYANVRLDIDVPEHLKGWFPRIVTSGNPGGIGHAWVKSRWIKQGIHDVKPMHIWWPREPGSMDRCFIPSRVYDNPKLQETDPMYVERLDNLPPHLREAYKEGNWDVFAGQVFDVLNPDVHRISMKSVPESWYLFRCMDWGHARPFSYGLYAKDYNNRLYRIREWYGWNGNPNEGMKADPEEVADGILQIESEFGGRVQEGPACPIMFNELGGPSIAERMGSKGVYFFRGDPDPVNGLIEVYTRLNPGDNGGTPMLLTVQGNDRHFWRTFPDLVNDDTRPEIIAKDQEDHVFEEVRLACMYHSLKPPKKRELEEITEQERFIPLSPYGGY